MLAFVLTLLFMLSALPAWSATYYVRPGGNDNNSCNSALTDNDNNAKQTIQNVVNNCPVAGDVVIVHGGTYASFSTVTLIPSNRNGGSWSNTTTIRAAPGETVTLQGELDIHDDARYWVIEGFIIDAGDTQEVAVLIGSAAFIRFRDVEVKNARHSGMLGCSNGCELLNVKSHHNGVGPNTKCDNPPVNGGQCHGIYMSPQGSFLIDGGEFHHNEGWGLHFYPDPENGTIRNIRTYENGLFGLGFIFGNGGHLVYNNLVYDNGHAGIQSNRPTQIYHNTLYGNDGDGLLLWGSGHVVHNNIIYNNAGTIAQDASNTVSHNLTENPGFSLAGSGDFHVAEGGPACGIGLNLAGTVDVDLEGNARTPPYDVGAYVCTANQPPPQPPTGIVAKYTCDEGSGLTVGDSIGTHHAMRNTEGWGAGLIGPFSCSFNGAQWAEITDTSGMNPTNHFTIFATINATTTDTVVGGIFSRGDSYALEILANGNPRCFFYTGAQHIFATAPVNVLSAGGMTRKVGCTKDLVGLRILVDNVEVRFVPTTASISYTLSANAQIGRAGDTSFTGDKFIGRIDQLYVMDDLCGPSCFTNFYNEQLPQPGTVSSHWRFYQADAPEGTTIAGQGVDAPNIVQARGGKLRMRLNAKRNGLLITGHPTLECNLNGASFVTLTTSCAINPACIATDSVKNSGDPTTDLDLPNDGFTFVPGIFEVDSVGVQTVAIADGQVTEAEFGLAFNQGLEDEDEVSCRIAGLDSYPSVLPKIIMDVPMAESNLKGGTFIGITTR